MSDPAYPPMFSSTNLVTLPDALSHVWANRENRPERQDEDLFSSGPPSPVLESFESGDLDEVELSDLSSESEEESRTSVHLTATQQLSTGFELQAARAGMCLPSQVS